MEHVPAGAKLLVVSKGDDEVLDLGGRVAQHFPQLEDGVYAGYYPADSGEAIAALEGLRSDGAQFLVFPQTSLWWLDYYKEFAAHLATSYRQVASVDPACVLYDLRAAPR
jgi:hypothetical protein